MRGLVRGALADEGPTRLEVDGRTMEDGGPSHN